MTQAGLRFIFMDDKTGNCFDLMHKGNNHGSWDKSEF